MKPDLYTGVEVIDAEHQELFKCVTTLFAKCREGKGKEEVLNTLTFLEDYINTHFRHEEEYMRKYNYKGYSGHVASHAQFVHLYKSLKSDYEKSGSNSFLVIKVNDLLKNWLLVHLKGPDKDLAKFLASKEGFLKNAS